MRHYMQLHAQKPQSEVPCFSGVFSNHLQKFQIAIDSCPITHHDLK